MSDTRLREIERDLAAHPTPEARDRLAAERTRLGDGPWLPVPYWDDDRAYPRRRWERDWPITQIAPGCFVFGGSRLDAILVDLRPTPRGVSAFWSIRDHLAALARRSVDLARGAARAFDFSSYDEARRSAAAGLDFPWIDPLAEARAAALDIQLRHGMRSLSDVAAELGLPPVTTL